MTKLSDTQLVILTAACQRDDLLVLPLPDRLKGGAATKVVDSLTARGLIEEVDAKRDDPVWRKTGDGHSVTLVATDAALKALGIEIDAAPKADNKPEDRAGDKRARKMREGSKQAQLIAMLGRAKGASIDEVVEVLGWQPHTVRGAIAGALKKKLGLNVTSEKVDGRGRVYCIKA